MKICCFHGNIQIFFYEKRKRFFLIPLVTSEKKQIFKNISIDMHEFIYCFLLHEQFPVTPILSLLWANEFFILFFFFFFVIHPMFFSLLSGFIQCGQLNVCIERPLKMTKTIFYVNAQIPEQHQYQPNKAKSTKRLSN